MINWPILKRQWLVNPKAAIVAGGIVGLASPSQGDRPLGFSFGFRSWHQRNVTDAQLSPGNLLT